MVTGVTGADIIISIPITQPSRHYFIGFLQLFQDMDK